MNTGNPFNFFIVFPTLGLLVMVAFVFLFGNYTRLPAAVRLSISIVTVLLIAGLAFGCVLVFAISTTGPIELVLGSAGQLSDLIRLGTVMEEPSTSLFLACCMLLPATVGLGFTLIFKLLRAKKSTTTAEGGT